MVTFRGELKLDAGHVSDVEGSKHLLWDTRVPARHSGGQQQRASPANYRVQSLLLQGTVVRGGHAAVCRLQAIISSYSHEDVRFLQWRGGGEGGRDQCMLSDVRNMSVREAGSHYHSAYILSFNVNVFQITDSPRYVSLIEAHFISVAQTSTVVELMKTRRGLSRCSCYILNTLVLYSYISRATMT